MTMASNGSNRFRIKCITVVLALLLLQVVLLLFLRPNVLFSNRMLVIRSQPNTQHGATSLGRSITSHSSSEGPPSISKHTNSTHKQITTAQVLGSITTSVKPPSKTLQPLNKSSSSTWKKGTFCERYIGNTFRESVTVCPTGNRSQSSLTCEGSSVSRKMVRCTARYLAVEPKKLQRIVTDCDTCNISDSGSFHLVQNSLYSCPDPSLKDIRLYSEEHDPVHRSMVDITSNPVVPNETCHTWINKTAYFFPSQRYHIYFRLYSYYNLHKTLLDNGAVPGDHIVVRMSEGTDYKFEKFERLLFPELRTLSEFPGGRVCFREVVFSPWAYANVMFRCKLEKETRWKCLECEGRGKLGTSLMTFRTQALQACSLNDQTPEQRETRKKKSIVFVKRKPYSRWEGDKIHYFQRVLSNQDVVVTNLKWHFPEVQVKDVFMEDFDLCEQMRLVHECDLYIGVHGAGLVHLWWLHDDATLLELAPLSYSQNPSFNTLAKLTGRRYHFMNISGNQYKVTADIAKLMDIVKNILSGKA